MHHFIAALLLFSAEPAPVDMPRVLDDRLQLELICQNPDVVTPVGLTIDAKGRLLVVESHTHFPPKDYAGPPHDRILLIDPSEKPAKPRVWFEGTKHTMSVARGPDDAIYVATRSEIFRLRDTDGDDRADERTRIAHLETTGNYPHNGLAGFAFRAVGDGKHEMIFGFGENLGADYKLIGTDGTALAGGGEGGNVYACLLDGSKLRRIATGFWNPFAQTFDGNGNLFVVDNDPDSRPPCRLLHVVEGGNYGFQFRHGRRGMHPFTAWNGELPGTLPMVCGTGEAPSAIVYYPGDSGLPAEFVGSILTTSWGDHRIERYAASSGSGFRPYAHIQAVMTPVVVGGENFRPVGMTIGPDGAIYFSDWVDKSYTLHGKGRIWKLARRRPPDAVDRAQIQKARNDLDLDGISCGTEPEWHKILNRLKSGQSSLDQLAPGNPFAYQFFSHLISERLRQYKQNEFNAAEFLRHEVPNGDAECLIWAAVAARDANPANAKPLVTILLSHDEPRVRLLGVMWVGNDGLTEFRDDIVKGLSKPGLTRELFECSLAALEMLEPKTTRFALPVLDSKRKNSGDYFALQTLKNPDSSAELKRFALKTLPADHPELKFDLLKQLAADADAAMRIEAMRTLRERPATERGDVLRSIAADAARDVADRAEAVIGLNADDSADRAVLESLASNQDARIAGESRRLLRPATKDERSAADRIAALSPNLGDAAAGERLFFHPRFASCYRCHEYAGRGAKIGPDLTTIHRTATREKILQSILDPSREVGPSFVPWLIETTDGRALTGLYVGEEVDGRHRYADASGKIFFVHPNEIERREAAKQSIMPADLGKTLTDEELRDLAAFLLRAE
jgi:putative membrane-bound dehydrogenase-like protein